MKKRAARGIIAVLLAFCMIACFGFGTDSAYATGKKASVKSVTLNHKVYTVKKGKTVTLKAVVQPKKLSKKDKKVTWTTSKKKVASVKNGKVKGLKGGKTKITAKAGKKKAVCTIYVGTPVKKAVFAKAAVTLDAGSSQTVAASVSPAKATVKKISYSSSDTKVATVDSKGRITAKSPGTTVITATPQDEAGKAAKLTVTVKDPVIAVTGLSVDPAEKTVTKGKSFKLTAKVSPANATNKKVSFKSSNEAVAAVDAEGNVKGLKKGSAEITATTADGGKAAVCKVKVISSGEEIVDDAEDLIDALNDDLVKKIVIKSDGDLTLSIGKEDEEVKRPDVDLVIDAPNGHIENYGEFKSVEIKAIGSSSFIEHAVGNVISYAARNGRIKVAENAAADIRVTGNAGKLNLVSDGNIRELKVIVPVIIRISGDTLNSIPVDIEKAAAGSDITTSKQLDIVTDAKIGLNIQAGAEYTQVSIADTNTPEQAKDLIPEVSGLGVIPVSLGDEPLENIVAQNSGDAGDSAEEKTLQVEGIVSDLDGNKMSGMKVSIIPFSGEMTTAEVEASASKAAYTATTADDGTYSISGVGIGNYYLLVQKDGYVSACSKLILTSNNNEKYQVSAISVSKKEAAAKKGRLSGRITDAFTGNGAEDGLTLRLRRGGNNVSGEVIAVTATGDDGYYEFDGSYEFGQYTVEIADIGRQSETKYASDHFDAVISTEGSNTANGTAAPTIESEQIRFVLTWGDEASGASADLDSHLIGPAADGEGLFHTWYSEKVYAEGNEDGTAETIYADLDVDDTDYEGPETTTIYRKTNGTYRFYIHDFTNRHDNSSTQMSRSKAVVQVYAGKALRETFNVPVNTAGILWHVCDYDARSNRIIPVNEIDSSWAGDPEDVGLSGEEILIVARTRLQKKIDKAKALCGKLEDGEVKAEGQALIAAGEDAYKTTDVQAIRAAGQDLDEWIESFENPLGIRGVHAWTDDQDGEETDLIDDWDTDAVYPDDDEDADPSYWTLTIYGVSAEMPENTTVEFRSRAVVQKWEPSDKEGFEKKLTATIEEETRTYYVRYIIPDWYKFGIRSISTSDNEEEDAIVRWDTDNEWYSDDETEEEWCIWYVDITGTEETLPANLRVTADYSGAEATLAESDDKELAEKMITVTCGGESRKYYVRYTYQSPDMEDLWNAEVMSDTSFTYSSDWNMSSGYKEVKLYVAERPDGLVDIRSNEGIEVSEPEESDREGFDEKVSFSKNGASLPVYIRFVEAEEMEAAEGILEPLDPESEDGYEERFFSFTVPQTGRYEIDVETGAYAWAELYDAQGSIGSAHTEDGAFPITVNLTQEETYYLFLYREGTGSALSYSVTRTGDAVDEADYEGGEE